MAARYKTCVCGRSVAGIVGLNPGCVWFVNVSFCQVEVCAMGRSLIQSPAECVCAIECDLVRATGTLYTYNERVEKGEERKKERRKYGRHKLFPTCFMLSLGDSPASEFYMPTFLNTLSLPSS